jgi:hypothetical protein
MANAEGVILKPLSDKKNLKRTAPCDKVEKTENME